MTLREALDEALAAIGVIVCVICRAVAARGR